MNIFNLKSEIMYCLKQKNPKKLIFGLVFHVEQYIFYLPIYTKSTEISLGLTPLIRDA